MDGCGAHDAADQRGKKGGWRCLSTDVSEDDGGAVGAVVDEVVEVSADGAGREETDRHLGVGVRRRGGRQQSELNLAGHGDIALQLPLLAADGLIETGVFDRDSHLGG